MILDHILRAIVEGGVSSQDDIFQHIIPGENDFFHPSHLGPSYSVHLPNDGTAVQQSVVDVLHPHGASSLGSAELGESGGGLIFPSGSRGHVGQWCGAHSDCESGVCSDPCGGGISWAALAHRTGQPCLNETGIPVAGFCQG